MPKQALLLAVDGGGTRCRARLCNAAEDVLGEAVTGPANIRFGLEKGFGAVLQASTQCMSQAGLSASDFGRIVACLALAGASEPALLSAAQRYKHPFGKAVIVADAHAACIGAHAGQDGGAVVVGTGTIGWALLKGKQHRVGGWGFPVSDEGSGAWFGCEAIRQALWAHDGRIGWTALLRALSEKFQSDPHMIVRWMSHASPGDFASLAPIVVDYALRSDPVAVNLMRRGASTIDGLALRLIELGVNRLSLVGGLAPLVESWLTPQVSARLTKPVGDALEGSLRLARAAADDIDVSRFG